MMTCYRRDSVERVAMMRVMKDVTKEELTGRTDYLRQTANAGPKIERAIRGYSRGLSRDQIAELERDADQTRLRQLIGGIPESVDHQID